MKRLFEEVYRIVESGEAAVLVTVIASSGSTPRGAGSRMLVRADGKSMGTIGGGAVEYRATQIAMDALREKTSYTRGFTLTKDQVSSLGMICGGNVTVYFQYISPENEEFKKACGEVLEALGRNEDSWLVLDISDETCWRMEVYNRSRGLSGTGLDRKTEIAGSEKEEIFDNRARQCQIGGRNYYIEPLVQAGMVYVFGGGHVAQELVPVLSHVGFRCVVMDDREEFANPRVFPEAEQTIVGDLERIADYLTIRREDYVCVMTRGHAFDYLVQRQVLASHPRYIGVIGSRNKVATVTEKLIGDGFSREEIEKCHMPIGMRIHAETPAEIAISIAGEMIAVRAVSGRNE